MNKKIVLLFLSFVGLLQMADVAYGRCFDRCIPLARPAVVSYNTNTTYWDPASNSFITPHYWDANTNSLVTARITIAPAEYLDLHSTVNSLYTTTACRGHCGRR